MSQKIDNGGRKNVKCVKLKNMSHVDHIFIHASGQESKSII